MALKPGELLGIHDLGCHALVLNAVVGHDSGGDATGDIGVAKIVVHKNGHKLMQGVEAWLQ